MTGVRYNRIGSFEAFVWFSMATSVFPEIFLKGIRCKFLLFEDPTENVALPRFRNASVGEIEVAEEIRLEANRTAQQDYKNRCDQAWPADPNGTTRRLPDQKARAMLFMSLGSEAKKRLTQRANEFRQNEYTLATFHAVSRPSESLRDFHAPLSKMLVKCDFGDRADSVVSDLFVTYMRDTELQDRLCMEQMDP